MGLNEPRLWTKLEEVPTKWAPEMFERSKASPLRLKYNDRTSVAFGHIFDAVVESPERLKTLHLTCDAMKLLSRLTKSMPFLEALDSKGSQVIPPNFLGGCAPRLHSFSVLSGNVPLKASWLANVRRLDLRGDWSLTNNESGRRVRMNLGTILAALANLHQLEVLAVDFRRVTDPLSLPDAGATVHLSRLHAVRFRFSTSHLANIFDYITADRLKHLSIYWPSKFRSRWTGTDSPDPQILRGICACSPSDITAKTPRNTTLRTS